MLDVQILVLVFLIDSMAVYVQAIDIVGVALPVELLRWQHLTVKVSTTPNGVISAGAHIPRLPLPSSREPLSIKSAAWMSSTWRLLKSQGRLIAGAQKSLPAYRFIGMG